LKQGVFERGGGLASGHSQVKGLKSGDNILKKKSPEKTAAITP